MRLISLLLVGVAACRPEPPDWPEPPADAASRCVYRSSNGSSDLTRTVYYDARGRVFRLDGYVDDDGDLVRAAYYYEYDEQDRLVHQRFGDFDMRYTYSPQQIVERVRSSKTSYENTYYLVDGRVMRVDNTSYDYDASGHITRIATPARELRFTYDEQGRLTKREDAGGSMELTYADRPGELVVELEKVVGATRTPEERWTIHYDDARRITRVAALNGSHGPWEVIGEFTYGPDRIEQVTTSSARTTTMTATGNCPLPAITFARPPLLPIPIQRNTDLVTPSYFHNAWDY